MSSRLREKYAKEVVPALQKEFGYTNVMAIPKIEKVVVNMGLGEATSNAKIVDVGGDELSKITGQRAITTKANPQKQVKGGIVEREAAIHASNVMLVDPDSSKPTRIGHKTLEDKTRVRVARRSGSVLDK